MTGKTSSVFVSWLDVASTSTRTWCSHASVLPIANSNIWLQRGTLECIRTHDEVTNEVNQRISWISLSDRTSWRNESDSSTMTAETYFKWDRWNAPEKDSTKISSKTFPNQQSGSYNGSCPRQREADEKTEDTSESWWAPRSSTVKSLSVEMRSTNVPLTPRSAMGRQSPMTTTTLKGDVTLLALTSQAEHPLILRAKSSPARHPRKRADANPTLEKCFLDPHSFHPCRAPKTEWRPSNKTESSQTLPWSLNLSSGFYIPNRDVRSTSVQALSYCHYDCQLRDSQRDNSRQRRTDRQWRLKTLSLRLFT